MYLRHPSKNSAVLLLVFLILGLIMTWVQGKAQGMRKFQMLNGWAANATQCGKMY